MTNPSHCFRDKTVSSDIVMKTQSSTQNCASIKDQTDITNKTRDFPQSCSDTETDCKDKEENSKDFSSISQDISQNVRRVELSQESLSKASLFNECTESSNLSNQYNKDPLRHMSDKSENSSLNQSCVDGTVKSKTKPKSLLEDPSALRELKIKLTNIYLPNTILASKVEKSDPPPVKNFFLHKKNNQGSIEYNNDISSDVTLSPCSKIEKRWSIGKAARKVVNSQSAVKVKERSILIPSVLNRKENNLELKRHDNKKFSSLMAKWSETDKS